VGEKAAISPTAGTGGSPRKDIAFNRPSTNLNACHLTGNVQYSIDIVFQSLNIFVIGEEVLNQNVEPVHERKFA
jgi:hypothetical protein